MGWIQDRIEQLGGTIGFRDFMELALYDPEHGYYARGAIRYGRSGDYLTAPTASGWYAAVMARVVGRLAARWGGRIRLVDVASGDGSFLAELLDAWAGTPGVDLELVSIERSVALRTVQQGRFAAHNVRIAASPEELEPDDSPVVFHASELYDALPVHRVIQRPDGLRELQIIVEDGELQWRETTASDGLWRYLENHEVHLDTDQVAEINLGAEPLHRRLLGLAGNRGVSLVLDYGYPARRLYDPRGRRGGSLACYHRHQLNRDPLQYPGEQDITAHVNWDDLRRAAGLSGWKEAGIFPLAELLIRGGIASLVNERGLGLERDPDAKAITQRQEIKRLLDPDGMGSELRVLIQATPAALPAVEHVLGLDS